MNFFETLKAEKMSASTQERPMNDPPLQFGRNVQTDSPSSSTNNSHHTAPVKTVGTASSNMQTVEEERMVSSSNTTLRLNPEADVTSTAFGGSLNFFSDPEIKLKLKKADGIPTMHGFRDNVAVHLPIRWQDFGRAVGIESTTLEAIEQRYSTLNPTGTQCFMEVFREWETGKSSYKPLTWQVVVLVLRYSLKEDEVAKIIENKFLNQDSATDSSQGSSLPCSLNSPSPQPHPPNPTNLPTSLPIDKSEMSNKGYVYPSPDFPFESGPLSLPSSSNFGTSQVPIYGSNPMGSFQHRHIMPPITTSTPIGVTSDQLYSGGVSQPHSLSSSMTDMIPRGVGGVVNYHSLPSAQQNFHGSHLTQHGVVSQQRHIDYSAIPPRLSPPMQQQGYDTTQQHVYGGYLQTGTQRLQYMAPVSDHPVDQLSTLSSSLKPPSSIKEQSSDSSYHSATSVIKMHDEVTFTELVQKYMMQLEAQQDERLRRPKKKQVKKKREPRDSEQKESLAKKELENCYERISSLEIRIQDLLMKSSVEIPEDHEVTYLQRDKLEQEFLRMREMKRQAEKNSMEAKQTTQRLVAENSRLKEEVALIKNDRELIVNQLQREIQRAKERDDHFKEVKEFSNEELKKKIAKKYKDLMTDSVALSRKETLVHVSGLPPMPITAKELFEIINTQSTKTRLGHVVITGLPGCGKTTILKGLLQNENPRKSLKIRGEETCMQVHELLITTNPLTEETRWNSTPGLESVVYLLSTVVAQYCFRNKCRPDFPSFENLEKEVRSIPSLQSKEVQQHFIRMYKAIKTLIEDKAKTDSLSDLALFKPTFFNIWDIGVNRVVYDFLGAGATHSSRLVLVVFLDLERDVPNMDAPPVMKRDTYFQRKDNEYVMRVRSRLEYLLILAGAKRWFQQRLINPEAPEAVIVGVHSKEFALLNDGKKLRDTVNILQRAVSACANTMKIGFVIDPTISTYCTNADNQNDEFGRLKGTIEGIVQAQPKYDTTVDAKLIFFRSLLYSEDNPMLVTRKYLSQLASKCGIYFEEDLDQFLDDFRNTGSLFFFPRSKNEYLFNNVILDVVKPLRLLDKLYYLLTAYSDSIPMTSAQKEQYEFGIVSKEVLKKLFEEDINSFLVYLLHSEECTDVIPSRHKDNPEYFFPTIRKLEDKSKPNKYSLFIKFDTQFLNCSACLSLYVKLFQKFFKVSDEGHLSPTLKAYNSVLFKTYISSKLKAVDVLVIYHLKQSIVEVRIEDLQENVHLDLCSKFIKLSTEVFEFLDKHIHVVGNYELCIMCPEEKESHFARFFLRYHQKEVYCKECNKSFLIKDNRLCWLS